MTDLAAIRKRHAGDGHTGLPVAATDQHRQAHADRGALLDAYDEHQRTISAMAQAQIDLSEEADAAEAQRDAAQAALARLAGVTVEEVEDLRRIRAWINGKRPCLYCGAGVGNITHYDGCWIDDALRARGASPERPPQPFKAEEFPAE